VGKIIGLLTLLFFGVSAQGKLSGGQPPSVLPPEYIYPPKNQAQPPPELVKCLSVVKVQFYDEKGRLSKGELVVNRDLVPDVKKIFALIKKLRFPIKSVEPIQKFGWSDEASILKDNTSAYNYRLVAGKAELSYHALGRAIDINPYCNPFIENGVSFPPGAIHNPNLPCAVDGKKGEAIVEAFKSMGWTWGGNWQNPKDYQHFQKPGANGRQAPHCK